MVFEMHYTTIDDWKKIRPDIKTIYILPKDIEITKSKILERNLSVEQEKERLKEIEEHYDKMTSDEKLRNMFDFIVYNNYDMDSEEQILNLVNRIKKNEENGGNMTV